MNNASSRRFRERFVTVTDDLGAPRSVWLSLGGGGSAARLLASLRGLPSAGPPPDLQNPELMRQILLALALGDETIGGAQAAELADRALELVQGDNALDPPAALEAAKQEAA